MITGEYIINYTRGAVLTFQIAYGVFAALCTFGWIAWQLYLEENGRSEMKAFSLIAEESFVHNFALIVFVLVALYWVIMIAYALISSVLRKAFP